MATVADIVNKAQRLTERSPADVQEGFEDFREAWNCVKVVTVPAAQLQSTVATILKAFESEGFGREVQTHDFGGGTDLLQVNQLGSSSFRSWRIYKVPGNSYSMYGHVSMYRSLGQGSSKSHAAGKKSWWQKLFG